MTSSVLVTVLHHFRPSGCFQYEGKASSFGIPILEGQCDPGTLRTSSLMEETQLTTLLTSCVSMPEPTHGGQRIARGSQGDGLNENSPHRFLFEYLAPSW